MIDYTHPARHAHIAAHVTPESCPDLYRDWTAHTYGWFVGDAEMRVPVAQWSRGPRHAATVSLIK